MTEDSASPAPPPVADAEPASAAPATSLKPPHLPDLTLRNFRCFKELVIPRLRHVNLIVGSNGVGKTALLEAVRIWVTKGAPEAVLDILEKRGEQRPTMREGGILDSPLESVRYTVANLFYGQPSIISGPTPKAGFETRRSSSVNIWVDFVSTGDYVYPDYHLKKAILDRGERDGGRSGDPYVVVQTMGLQNEKGNYSSIERLIFIGEKSKNETFDRKAIGQGVAHRSCILVPQGGLGARQLFDLWAKIAASLDEDTAIETLQLLRPEVRRVVGAETNRGIQFMARVNGMDRPQPLKLLGGGALRAFGLGVAFANCRGGVLLIDEFENGLHWEAQPEVWKAVFHLARKLDVQVFATTHSFDCVKGFAEATKDHPGMGQLLRLERHRLEPERIIAVSYPNDAAVQAAAERGTEVR